LAFFGCLDCELGILFAVIKNAPSGYVLGLITAVVVVAAGWLFVNYTPVGQDDNHVLSIASARTWVIMLFNVWGIIWRIKRRLFVNFSRNSTSNAQLWHASVSRVTNKFLSVGTFAVFMARVITT